MKRFIQILLIALLAVPMYLSSSSEIVSNEKIEHQYPTPLHFDAVTKDLINLQLQKAMPSQVAYVDAVMLGKDVLTTRQYSHTVPTIREYQFHHT